MKPSVHAIGKSQDVLAFAAIGAEIHEADTSAAAEEALKALARSSNATGDQPLVLLTEEFASVGEKVAGACVFIVPGIRASERTGLEKVRELVSRSVGVDLIAKAGRGSGLPTREGR